MEWERRGDTLPASRAEYNAIRIQVEHGLANKVSQMSTEGDDGNQGRDQGGNNRPENPNATKNAVVKARLKDYCQKGVQEDQGDDDGGACVHHLPA